MGRKASKKAAPTEPKAGPTYYINTDLDLHSASEPEELISALVGRGFVNLHSSEIGAGKWLTSFEIGLMESDPDSTIRSILSTVEDLSKTQKAQFKKLNGRHCNIGFQAGAKPHVFECDVSSETLKRMAALDIELKVTIYGGETDTG